MLAAMARAGLAPRELRNEQGSVSLTAPAPGVLVARFDGKVSSDLVPGILAYLEQLPPGPTDFFYDAWDMQAYDSLLRTELTSWHLRRRADTRSLHTVTRSKIVRMGISVANLALGIITAHEDRSSFDRAIDRAIGPRPSG